MNAALEIQDVSTCEAFDSNDDGKVSVNELVGGVAKALTGCVVPTATSSQTSTATDTPAPTITDTPTRTPTVTDTPTHTPTVTDTETPTATPTPRFLDNGDGTISDSATNLVWEKKDNVPGSIHEYLGKAYQWAGECAQTNDLCQPDEAALGRCPAEALGCMLCSTEESCRIHNAPLAPTTAFDWVAELNASQFAGYADWRIPTRWDLESIVDRTSPPFRLPVDPVFDTDCPQECTVLACSCTAAVSYWSATTLAFDSASAHVVDFAHGQVGALPKNSIALVRAVRGSPLPTPTATPPRFVDNGDGSVTDSKTQLTWERKIAGDGDPANLNDVNNRYRWAGECDATAALCQASARALQECPFAEGHGCFECDPGFFCRLPPASTTVFDWIAALNESEFAVHSDWRLPTLDELRTIVFEPYPCSGNTPCIDAIFGPTASYFYWSVTIPNVGAPSAGTINFSSGQEQFSKVRTNAFAVRAVRGPQLPASSPSGN